MEQKKGIKKAAAKSVTKVTKKVSEKKPVTRKATTKRVAAKPAEIKRPKAEEITRPKAAEVASPKAAEVAPPKAEEVTRPKAAEVAPPKAAKVTPPKAEEVTRPKVEEVARSPKAVSKPEPVRSETPTRPTKTEPTVSPAQVEPASIPVAAPAASFAPAPSASATQGYWQDRYSEDRIVLMVRDPYWCFTYWDLTSEKQANVIKSISEAQAKLLLRVYDVTGIDFNGSNAHRFMDIEVTEESSNWYVNVWASDRAYCVDLGLLFPDGRFETLVRSNIVTTPRDSISPVIDEEWMVVDETFDRLYKTAGAEEWGRSSEAITKYMLKRVRADVTSGGFASMGSEGGRPRPAGSEDFWLVVNTELIVYGATESDAKVTIQGKPIRLNEDGTFSVRYALPDGKQEIPVKAVNASGSQERQITPVVEKRTV